MIFSFFFDLFFIWLFSSNWLSYFFLLIFYSLLELTLRFQQLVARVRQQWLRLLCRKIYDKLSSFRVARRSRRHRRRFGGSLGSVRRVGQGCQVAKVILFCCKS